MQSITKLPWALWLLFIGILITSPAAHARGNYAGKMDRPLRYHPEGTDFVIVNGERSFNRPLYGVPTSFIIQAGDKPQFALYRAGKDGVLRLGIVTPQGSKWLDSAQTITARYRPGSMIYEITDPLLGSAKLTLTAIPRADTEGLIVKAELSGTSAPITLVWAFGGASGAALERNGDLIGGNDLSVNYALRPGDCTGEKVAAQGAQFTVTGPKATLTVTGPDSAVTQTGDAAQMETPSALLASRGSLAPVAVGQSPLSSSHPLYLSIEQLANIKGVADTAAAFTAAEARRKAIADRVVVDTPDPYFNASVSNYCVVGNAIWDSPHYMHGANAWRSPLLGWRGPYVADVLGWHDRARTHFSYWASKQNTDATDIPTDAHPDPAKNLAENDGKTLRSYGAIPAGHYDMAMVYIDELFWHFNWTGDMAYVKQTWPVIKRHLAWEKRNFDRDGLYEAYCAIWASDAMQYNGGGTTHSSAYNYLHFLEAARIAKLVGEDPAPYAAEATRIHAAMQSQLWLPKEGWYGEYKDILGLKLLHPAAAVYTVYHTIDSQVPDPFQAYQMLRYVDTQIPHIPIQGPGVPTGKFAVVATSNWLPYQWSLNNVVLAETEHTALSYWQAGQPDAAWLLWKGGMLDSMYIGACPGDIPNLSQYDINRGESYRDFGDPTGIGARALIEGLFGILPDALAHEITLRPGFPKAWGHASIRTPDIAYSFQRTGTVDTYKITPTFGKPMRLILQLTAHLTQIASVTVNGQPAAWVNNPSSVGSPEVTIQTKTANNYTVIIHWQGAAPAVATNQAIAAQGGPFKATFGTARLVGLYDPQGTLGNPKRTLNSLTASVTGITGHRTAFAQVGQGGMKWWLPIAFEARPPFVVIPTRQDADSLRFRVQNNTATPIHQAVLAIASANGIPLASIYYINMSASSNPKQYVNIPAFGLSDERVLNTNGLPPGTTEVDFTLMGKLVRAQLVNWNTASSNSNQLETQDITSAFNDKVTQIFKNDYLSPRSPYTSLEIPIHGIGSWSSPTATADIDDSGLRSASGTTGVITTPQGIPFRTPGTLDAKNIAFTSQWDNYPHSLTIPLSGNATHAYLLMAGSTEPMQSRLDNGEVVITYADGDTTRLALNNPTTWWPIDQDYVMDDYAFQRDGPLPPRLSLRTGTFYMPDGTSANMKQGGMATVLDMPLDPTRPLKSITVTTLANDVVIGLMSVTLARPK